MCTSLPFSGLFPLMERAIFAYKYPGVRALFQGAVCLFRGWLCGCVGLLSQILRDGSQRVAQPKILFERVLGQKPLGILVLQDATQDHNQCWFMLFAPPYSPIGPVFLRAPVWKSTWRCVPSRGRLQASDKAWAAPFCPWPAALVGLALRASVLAWAHRMQGRVRLRSGLS